MKVVIVGGVAGGASAAARIRRLDEHAQIVMIERSGYVSYANCGLPYYVGGVIKEQEELTLQTPESFWDRFRIDVRVRQEVTAVNPTEKTVTVHALDSGKVYTETYDKLLLAPGAKPTVPALSGVSSERVFTLRTVEDTLRIRHFVEDQKPKSAVLAGGGQNLKEPCLGRTFLWEEDSPGMLTTEQYREEQTRSDIYRVRQNTDECIQFTGAGYILTGVTEEKNSELP